MALPTISGETLDIRSPRPISPDSADLSSSNPCNEHEPHHIGVPDSGRRAWLVVFGGFLNFTASFGLLNSFGTFEAQYERSMQLPTSTVTWIGSLQMFILFLSGILVGPAFDKWGARKLMLSGTFLCLVAFISCSFATRFYQFLLAQGFLFGLGCALLFYPTTSAVSEWFDKRRGLALGLVCSGASAGGILWPMVLNEFFMDFNGAKTHRLTAAIAIPMLLLSCVLVRERHVRLAGHDMAGNEVKASQTSISKAIWDTRFLGLSSALLFINCGMMVPFFYIPGYAQDNGVDTTMSNNLLAISYSASLVGRIFTGWVADHIGRFNMLILISILTSLATFSFISAKTLTTFIAFSVLFGFSSGGIVPLGSACVAQTTPDMGHLGLRIGTMMAISSIGTLAGGPATGAIKGATHAWPGVFIFCGAVTMAGAGILCAVRVVSNKRLVF
ncbi:hypothetical protein LMH87_000784 [Akanthomyces muscarius]|uniref:Major facilitator superfamily (MFS) profile domain-containing protein n=1 Tax=Akanthomyces muscarius TaxID=2231603 RepID=A0A9W8QFQ2_AKAMU|nr:hypothetical protein LMH87_000784 [Akanthomyces muscarius]KAJ4155545.1 hypothetical protein LMH87_000784 [Akanthomyces muscarius]